MKYLLILLFSINCFSQEKHPDTDFFINNGKVYWEHIFNYSKNDSIELMKRFKKEILLTNKIENLIESENSISFQISDDMPNFRKYGGTSMGTPFIAQMYMKYLVTINFKNEKYRVIVQDIFLDNKAFGGGHMSGFLQEFVGTNKYQNFKKSNALSKGLTYDEKHFIDKFQLNSEIKKDW